jgi:hypothetical protein
MPFPTTREEAVDFRHLFPVSGYISATFGLPQSSYGMKGLIFHYTNVSGLLGIVQSNRLWATHAGFLNDLSERNYTSELAKSAINEQIASSTDLARLYYLELMSRLGKPYKVDYYVSCFCREGDLLSQWRGYGAFGVGLSIGFDIEELRPHPQVAQLFPMSYDEELHLTVIREIIQVGADHHLSHPNHPDDTADLISSVIEYFGGHLKHPKYKEEDEIRLHINRDDKDADHIRSVRFRTRGNEIIPYVPTITTFDELSPDLRLPIREVIVGPGLHYGKTSHALELLFRQNGIDNIEVKRSNIPFSP